MAQFFPGFGAELDSPGFVYWHDDRVPDGSAVVDEQQLLLARFRGTDQLDPVDGEARIEEGAVLGAGGMGTVRQAHQNWLRRDVALKAADGATAQRRLVREAHALALVEHPKILPIYDFLPDGVHPRVVLRRIEGVPWKRLLAGGEHPKLPEAAGARLAWHLNVLAEVCDALEAAHAQGLLHLDIKPDNIMVGADGDVYLLDWGIAASTRAIAGIPRVSELRSAVGSPAYMAPEMARLERDRISERTDVYLLGATLHEVLARRPPHQTRSIAASLKRAAIGADSALPPSVPDELRDLCARALRADPDERLPSVAAFRGALRRYLRHRGAAATCARAMAQLDRLEKLVAGDDASAGDVEDAFGQARYGFEATLQRHPESREAIKGLRRALLTMVAYLRSHQEPARAAVLLDEVDEPPEELRGAIEAECEAHQRELGALERLRRDEDLAVSDRSRALLAGSLALFIGLPGAVLVHRAPELIPLGSYGYHFALSIAFVVVLSVAAFVGRRTLLANLASRRLVLAMLLLGCALIGQRVLLRALGVPVTVALPIDLGLLALVASFPALFAQRRLVLPATVLAAGALVGAFRPDHADVAMSASTLLVLLLTTFLWAAPWRSDELAGKDNTERTIR